jgi:hypothetical protein
VFPPRTTLGTIAELGGHLVITGGISDRDGPYANATPYLWRASA